MNDLLEFLDIKKDPKIDLPFKKIMDLLDNYKIEYHLTANRIEFRTGKVFDCKEVIIYRNYKYMRKFLITEWEPDPEWEGDKEREDQIFDDIEKLIDVIKFAIETEFNLEINLRKYR